MSLLTIDQSPTITDDILFDLFTTDSDGNLINPYEVNQVTIYFVERDYSSSNLQEFDVNIKGISSTFTYKNAQPIKVFGTDEIPAWLSSDTQNAFLTKVDFDEEGNVDTGHFQLIWSPSDTLGVREGDYFICHTWTEVANGDSSSKIMSFYLGGNFTSPTVPSHRTNPNKYPTLLERYTPEMFKKYLVQNDVSPETIQRTNLAVADGFTELENLSNQIIDLYNANVIQEAFLPYLANMFRWKLRGSDPTLWRRQVRNAIQLYKKKGTLGGLREALDECGIEFKKITYYWQIVSKATWQEAFIVEEDQTVFCLSKIALDVDDYNFHVWYRSQDSTEYTEVPLSYVEFNTTTSTNSNCENNTVNQTCVTWITDDLELQTGDVVRILYKIKEPTDQSLESYIQSLDLADQRDELQITHPSKNWNVRLIAEDDEFFNIVVPIKHAFVYPVVYGKVRTEFPYSEKIYNMEEYNGSTRDSENPCDLDYTFFDSCSACRSSKISIDVAIEELSNDRIVETEEIIKDFLPFHAILHSINYVGLQDEIIPPPIEEIECLIQYNITENIYCTQFDFDRLIIHGNDPDNVTRSMLADTEVVASGNDGVGYNLAYSIFSPGIQFGEIGINNNNNILEILSGTNQGEYTLQEQDGPNADVIGISQWPLDPSGFPFRFSNIQYAEMGASVYQDNLIVFTDESIDFSLFPIPNNSSWIIKITSGLYVGNYPINKINSDNSLVLDNWTNSNTSGFSYELIAPGDINVTNSDFGEINVVNRGRVQTQALDLNSVSSGDYLLMDGNQYTILFINSETEIYIKDYSDGDQVGTQNIQILRRLVDNAVGYLNFRGLKLTTTINYETSLGIQNGQNPVTPVLDNSDFKEHYYITIDSQIYVMADIDGQDIYLTGPVQEWGLAGQTTGVDYIITQITNNAVTIQSGYDEEFRTFEKVTRNQDGVFVIQQNLMLSPSFHMNMLSQSNQTENIVESVKTQEKIWYQVILKNE